MTVAITASIAQLLSALSRALQHVQLRRSIGRTAPVVITVQNNIRRPRRFQRPRQRPSEYHAGYKPLFEKESSAYDGQCGKSVSHAPERLGRGQARGSDRREQPSEGADEDRGTESAGPCVGRDDDRPVFGVRINGGGGAASQDPYRSPDQGEQDRLGQELGADLAPGGAERSPQPDLLTAFQHGDDHDVRDPDRADQQGDGA